MRLLILGASGATGSWAVHHALDRGHAVTAVVRPGSTVSTPMGEPKGPVEYAVGEVTDPAFVRSVTRSRFDAIVSCLGLRRAGTLPWSPLLSPPNLVETVTRNLLSALEDVPVRRVIWISAGGVGDSVARTTGPIRAVIRAGNVGLAYRDLERAEALIPPEDRRWLAVRPVTLMNGPMTGRADRVERYGLFSIIRRADLASWMVDVADGTRSCAGPNVLLGTGRL